MAVVASSVTLVEASALMMVAGEMSARLFDEPTPSVPSSSMTIVSGSSSQVPVLPRGAVVSIWACGATLSTWPEVSTKPPLPPIAPPMALTMPEKSVRPFDHTTSLPPLPRREASTVSVARPTWVLAALAIGPAPWAPPPIRIVPPPMSPEAVIVVPSATVTLWPVIATEPPVWPARTPEASMLPETLTSPSPPSSTTSPFCSLALVAVTMPVVLITAPATSAAARAVISTRPPLLACTVPELETPVWPLSALPAGAVMA